MKLLFIRLLSFLLLFGFLFSAPRGITKGPVKMKKTYQHRIESMHSAEAPAASESSQSRVDRCDGDLEDDSWQCVKVDEAKNGYAMITSATNNVYVDAEEEIGFFVYRQWAGEEGSSGQIGGTSFEFANDLGSMSTLKHTNINSSGEMWGCDPTSGAYGGCGIGRYPSATGNGDAPYAVWNEYTVNSGGTGSFGGRPYYSYDQLGWGGDLFSYPSDVDFQFTTSKDLWIASPVATSQDGVEYLNVTFADWTRNNGYLFHSEVYDPSNTAAPYIMGTEVMLFDEINDFVNPTTDGSYMSTPQIHVNDDGVGYAAVSAYFMGGDQGTSEFSNIHTMAFKMTSDHGASWTGGTNTNTEYYFIPDDVFEHMFDNDVFPRTWEDPDGCPDSETYTFEDLFCTYDFDVKVDANGDPHFVVGVLPTDAEYVYPGIDPACGYYHFTIDKEYLANPGVSNTETGWNYSFVGSAMDTWMWTDAAGSSYWQIVFPEMAISVDDPDNIFVVSSMVTVGEEIDPDDDPCTLDSTYPEWSQDVYVWKSVDGGDSWWCPLNASGTADPDPTDVDSPEEISVHTANEATDDEVYIGFHMPDYIYGSTTGDAGDADMKQEVYLGKATIDSQPECAAVECPADPGDANADGGVNVLDIVAIVNNIIFETEVTVCAADYNGDTVVDIFDIIQIVGFLVPGKSLDATQANIIKTDEGLSVSANGSVGAIQMTLVHDEDFQIELTDDALAAAYNTVGLKTTLLVVAPGSDQVFSSTGEYKVSDVVIASASGQVDINIATQIATVSNYPNPFNPETVVSYELYSDGLVELDVYNVSGQKVASLFSGDLAAGSYSTVWNGLDSNGLEVASGMYILQLRTASELITHKITLLR